MYKKIIVLQLTSLFLVAGADATWSSRVQRAAELDKTGRFIAAGTLYAGLVNEAETMEGTDARRSDVFNNAGAHAFYVGDYAKADTLYSAALSAYKEAGESDNNKLSSILANTTALHRVTARYAEGEKTGRLAVALNPSSVGAWNNLAELYRAEGKFDDAESAARKVIELTPTTEQDGRVQVLASVLRDKRKLDEALNLYNRALKYQERTGTVSIATTLANIAEVQLRRGDYGAAENATNRALEIWQSAGIKATPGMAAALNNLAQLRKLQGRYMEAEPLYRRALATWEGCVGKNHPDYAKGLTNLADYFAAIGNHRAAEKLYAQASGILASSAGPGSRAAEDITARRVLELQAMGRFTDANRLNRVR